jgi:hypothetical protein
MTLSVRPPASNGLSIRTMRPDEVSIAVNWAAAEGWNPGLSDDACFVATDPEGFFIGELDGAPAATVSCVNYDKGFAFLGFYIVRADLRARGGIRKTMIVALARKLLIALWRLVTSGEIATVSRCARPHERQQTREEKKKLSAPRLYRAADDDPRWW